MTSRVFGVMDVVGLLLRRACSLGASCRDVAPAGDLLFERPKRRQKVAPVPSPLRCAAGSPALLGGRGRAQLASFTAFTTLRQRGAKSEDEARCARAPTPCDARLLQRGVKEQPNIPTAKPESRSVVVFRLTPFSAAEERKALRRRAQHASTSDSAQLFERSVAKRVLRGASRLEYRREPRSEAQGRRGRGELFAYFLAGQKVGRPPGRTPGTTAGAKVRPPEAPNTPAPMPPQLVGWGERSEPQHRGDGTLGFTLFTPTYTLCCRHKKVGRPPGRTPGTTLRVKPLAPEAPNAPATPAAPARKVRAR